MKDFLHSRRSALSCVIPGSGNASNRAHAQRDIDTALPVSEKCVNELDLLSKKQNKRNIDAVHELLPEECYANFVTAVAAHENHNVKTRQARCNADQRKHSRLNRTPFGVKTDLRATQVPTGSRLILFVVS